MKRKLVILRIWLRFLKAWLKIWTGKRELMVPTIALLIWAGIYLIGWLFNIYAYPIGYWQKIAFGVIGASVITGAGWVAMAGWAPELKTLIDPDTATFEGVSKWEKIKLAFGFFALYVWSATQLASLY